MHFGLDTATRQSVTVGTSYRPPRSSSSPIHQHLAIPVCHGLHSVWGHHSYIRTIVLMDLDDRLAHIFRSRSASKMIIQVNLVNDLEQTGSGTRPSTLIHPDSLYTRPDHPFAHILYSGQTVRVRNRSRGGVLCFRAPSPP